MNRAVFESWLSRHCDYDDLNKSEIELAYEAWQAAMQSPEVRKLREALEMIAGIRPCPDSLMGNADIARAALAQEES